MKRAWVVGAIIVLASVAKFGYDYFYFDKSLNHKPIPVESAAPSPTPTISESPTAAPLPPTREEIQIALNDMKIPVGKIDGKFGLRTRQALCIWRELTGRDVNRNLPSQDEQYAIVAQEDLTLPKDFVVGLNINKTCQSAVWVKSDDKKWFEITTVSTGRPGLETDTGIFKVQWRVNRWYESIAYPDGWMYRPLFFNKGQAVHGSEFDAWVYPYPASHGCVRMLGAFMDSLWANGFGNGSTVRVYGNWNPITNDPTT
ncbi:MAG: L,D-transpeptidase family protein [Actinomycetales bacterium]|nr:L,D-transpeptidase family protein [Actinomycetales bacterium]